MLNNPVIIKFSDIIKLLNTLPMNEFGYSRYVSYVRTDDEENDKIKFLRTLFSIIHYDAQTNVHAEAKKLIREFEDVFDSVADSLWERIKYENVNFFVNDVKANVYETAINMFMKKCFGEFNVLRKKGIRNNIDSIVVKLVDTDETVKVCNLRKLFDNIYHQKSYYNPDRIYDMFVTFYPDCLPNVFDPYRLFLIIHEFYKYYEINKLILGHMHNMISRKFKHHESFINILTRNDIFMKSFAIEYSKFSKKFISSIAKLNLRYPDLRKCIADEIYPILLNKDSHVGDLAECDFARDMLNILNGAKSMSAPNMDYRCDTLCENLEELENSYINTFNALYELKEKVFEPLKYDESVIESIYDGLFDCVECPPEYEECPPDYETYKDVLYERISEAENVCDSIKSVLEAWCINKIEDKVNYGYNYDAINDISEYFRNEKYVNDSSFVKFSNPTIFNLIYNFRS